MDLVLLVRVLFSWVSRWVSGEFRFLLIVVVGSALFAVLDCFWIFFALVVMCLGRRSGFGSLVRIFASLFSRKGDTEVILR